jgi:hypothetical protein
VDADAACIGFHLAFADHEHGASPIPTPTMIDV